MQVLRSRDRQWRLEVRGGWCWLYRYGGLVLGRASLDAVARYLVVAGVDPDRDMVAD